MMNLLDALNWRYATKRMNGQSIPEAQIQRILEAVRLAPSSYGLQPYRVKVIATPELLSRIHAEAAPQPQVIGCSHLVIFATLDTVDEISANASQDVQ